MRESASGRVRRNIVLVFAVFTVISALTGALALKNAEKNIISSFGLKCASLSSTVAAVIAADADGYKEFLRTLDTDGDYYKRTKNLMMSIKQANIDYFVYVYTENRVDDDTMMYVIGGDNPASPTYTPPGVRNRLTETGRAAYESQTTTIGEVFEDTEYGTRMSAYAPIIHPETGEFLGLVGSDIIRSQFDKTMYSAEVQSFSAVIIVAALFGAVMLIFYADSGRTLNRDVMTRLYNKSHFKRRVKAVLREASKSRRTVYVIVADIDRFKYINDAYGHAFGDKIIVAVSKLFAESMRPTDFPSRYGGGDFAACLTDISDSRIREIMENIRLKVKSLTLTAGENADPVKITISLGAAEIPVATSVNDALSMANHALYNAKHTRDACAVFQIP